MECNNGCFDMTLLFYLTLFSVQTGKGHISCVCVFLCPANHLRKHKDTNSCMLLYMFVHDTQQTKKAQMHIEQ